VRLQFTDQQMSRFSRHFARHVCPRASLLAAP
jgi:hypothetical protein